MFNKTKQLNSRVQVNRFQKLLLIAPTLSLVDMRTTPFIASCSSALEPLLLRIPGRIFLYFLFEFSQNVLLVLEGFFVSEFLWVVLGVLREKNPERIRWKILGGFYGESLRRLLGESWEDCMGHPGRNPWASWQEHVGYRTIWAAPLTSVPNVYDSGTL